MKYHPILESTRTTYFGSLTGDKEIESGEFTDELKIKGLIKVAKGKMKGTARAWKMNKAMKSGKGITETGNITRKREQTEEVRDGRRRC